MIQTLTRNWWLLALCGVLEAPISVIYLSMYNAGPEATPLAGWHDMAVLSSRLALAAGVCSIAAGIWRPAKGTFSLQVLLLVVLLVLNGLALDAFGGIGLFWRGPLGFRVFALLIAAMAMTIGILELAIARALRRLRHVLDELLFGLAGGASVGVALAFLALVNGWIPLERRAFHPAVFLWVCLYFAFSAICMLGMGLRLHGRGNSQSGQWEALPPLGNPGHA